MSELKELKLEAGWLEAVMEQARISTEEYRLADKRIAKRMKQWERDRNKEPRT